MSVLRYIVRVTRRKQIELVVLVVAGTALGLLPIHLFRLVLDRAIPQRDTSFVYVVGGSLVAIVLARLAINFRQAVVSEQIRQGFSAELRGRLYAHVLRLSPQFFAKHSVGNLVHRVQLEVGRLAMSVAWILIEPIVHAVTVVVYLAYLLSMSVPLTLLALACVPVVLIFAPRINRRLSANERAFTGIIGAYVARMTEGFAGIYEVQAHATYGFETGRLDAQQRRVSQNRVDGARHGGWLDVLSELTRGVGPVLVYTYGALMAIAGRMTVGEIVAFTGTLGGLYLALDKLVKYPPQLATAQDRFDELGELLAIPRTFVDPPNPPEISADSHAGRPPVAIRLENVTFGYDAKEPLLSDLTLDLAAGEHVVLVGRSGCGKSTIMGLVSGRLTPRSGEVHIDGRAIAAEPASSLARTIGIVGQHPFLFHATLRDNLLYALLRRPARGDALRAYADVAALGLDPSVDATGIDDELVRACRDVGLDEELLDFGLEARVAAADAHDLLPLRAIVRARLADDAAVERFEPGVYLARATVGENLLFGSTHTGVRAQLDAARAAGVIAMLARIGLDDATRDLDQMLRVRRTSPALFAELDVDGADLDARERLVERIGGREPTEDALGEALFRELCERGLRARTNDAESRARIVSARTAFVRALGGAAGEAYDLARWHPALAVRENLLFGRIDAADLSGSKRVRAALDAVLREADLLDRVSRLGLAFEVGEKGARLSGGQRQKVSIARVLLKRAPVLLLDEATASLDKRSAAKVHDLITDRWRGRTLVAITHDLVLADRFDRVVVLDKGHVVEDGKPAELLARGGTFKQLYDAATIGGEP